MLDGLILLLVFFLEIAILRLELLLIFQELDLLFIQFNDIILEYFDSLRKIHVLLLQSLPRLLQRRQAIMLRQVLPLDTQLALLADHQYLGAGVDVALGVLAQI